MNECRMSVYRVSQKKVCFRYVQRFLAVKINQSTGKKKTNKIVQWFAKQPVAHILFKFLKHTFFWDTLYYTV